jgi:hypothetical protein
MRLGEKTHHIIADYLRLLAKNIQIAEEELQNLQQAMTQTMEREFRLSQSKDYTSYDKLQKFGFKEHAYGENIDHMLSEGIAKVLGNLQAFRDSDIHDTIASYFTAQHKYYIEPNQSDFDQMQISIDNEPRLRGVVLRAQPDFGIQGSDKHYYIYDRKSWIEKELPPTAITDQLKVYAYRLLHKSNATIQDIYIHCHEVYLPSLHTIGGPVTQQDIDDIIETICDQVQEKKNYLVKQDPVANKPLPVSSFPRTTDISVCASCKFRRACAALKQLEADTTTNPYLDDYVSVSHRLL